MLNMHMWDQFKPEDISPQLKYWADYWGEVIGKFPDPNFGLKLDSPRLVVTDVLDEIKFNNLRNKKVKSYFSNKVSLWSRNKNVIGTTALGHMQLLHSAFSSEPQAYIEALCKQCLSYLNSGQFFNNVLEFLVASLIKENASEKDFDDIALASDLLIIEFTARGFSLQTCEKFPNNIFSGITRHAENLIFSDFPHKTDYKTFETSGEVNWKAFGEALEGELGRLSIQDRLMGLRTFFEAVPEIYQFIFPLTGIRCEKELSFGNVKIYSPLTKKHLIDPLSKDPDSHPEYFGRKRPHVFANALVTLPSIDVIDTNEKAHSMVESALDLLSYIWKREGKPTVANTGRLVLREGHLASQLLSMSDNPPIQWSWRESLNLNEIPEKTTDHFEPIIGKILSEDKVLTDFEKQLSAALHWYRKATQEKHSEDKILNLWVVLEKLFKNIDSDEIGSKHKIDVIIELLPSIYVRQMIFDPGWNLHSYLLNLVGSSQGGKKIIELPDEIIKMAKLKPKVGEYTHIEEVVASLDLLKSHSDKNIDRHIIKQKINHVYRYFTDNKYAVGFFEETLRDIETDLLLIYRYRNKVVHDAHYDDRMLPYYVKKAERYTSNILGYLFYKAKEPDSSVINIANEAKADVANMLKKLKLDPKFTLLNQI
jgi:hypothetical protein